MNTAHTPGPWKVSVGYREDGYAKITSEAHFGLASVVVEVDGKAYPKGESNARLIAAAPEMLAALEAALLELEANKAAMVGPGWAAQRTMTGGAILAVSRAIHAAKQA